MGIYFATLGQFVYCVCIVYVHVSAMHDCCKCPSYK